MTGTGWTRLLCAALPAAALWLAPVAQADEPPPLRGDYALTFHTDQKTGTSAAASQYEVAYKRNYAFATVCSPEGCSASIVDGSAPKIAGSPQPLTVDPDNPSPFHWDGQQWVQTTRWQWDCLWPDGTVEWNPATSRVTLKPDGDGVFTGIFSTDISRGVCEGTVNIPVTARLI